MTIEVGGAAGGSFVQEQFIHGAQISSGSNGTLFSVIPASGKAIKIILITGTASTVLGNFTLTRGADTIFTGLTDLKGVTNAVVNSNEFSIGTYNAGTIAFIQGQADETITFSTSVATSVGAINWSYEIGEFK